MFIHFWSCGHRSLERSRCAARGLCVLGALASGCAETTHLASQTPTVKQPATMGSSPAGPATPAQPSGATGAPRSEGTVADLTHEATLPAILKIVLATNPELAEVRARAQAAKERAPAASRLPDPVLEYQLWAQPLARPYALDQAGMHMFGLRQALPAPGSLHAQAETGAARAAGASAATLVREQELVARVRNVYAQYYRTTRQYELHLDHMRIAQQTLEIARAVYQAGRGTQQDVLRVMVEVSRLHNDLAGVDRDRRSARALLNVLMARAPEAPLGPPVAPEPGSPQLRLAELARSQWEGRAELALAQSAVRVRQGELDAAHAVARWPSFMLGVQYMYMPPAQMRHNYGVMLSMSLPWLNPRYGEEARAAEATLAAERSALESTKQTARYQLFEAARRVEAARESLTIIERDLLPQAQQSFDAASAAYQSGQGDSLAILYALRSLLDVRLERERALALVSSALADLDRASGSGGPLATAERE